MVCPDRRIDRLCITCCSPFPTVTTRRTRRDLIHAASATGFLVALAPGHHCPSHSGHLVGKRDGSNLGGPPRYNAVSYGRCLVPWSFRIADDGERTGCEQAAQVTIALLLMLPSLSCLRSSSAFGTSPIQPRSPVPLETPWDQQRLANQSSRQRRTDARDRVEPLAGFNLIGARP